jgi:glyoxylase-like metal-dependent hydrolase (beta-lactamase superfamily II)
MQVGRYEIQPLFDGVALLPATDMLRYTGPLDDPWIAHRQFLVDGNIELAMGGFAVRLNERVVVIDCGVGPIDRPPFRGGAFLDSLGAAGVAPSEVTDVLFTHLHFDHVGWATQQGRPVFSNATYRCHRKDWVHFAEGDEAGAVRKLAPLADRMEFWEKDATLFPGLDVQGAPGHTPGSTIFVLSDGRERAMLLGDVVHCPIEFVDDDWEALFDVDPQLAQRTRTALARELDGTDTPVAAAHFPGLQFGRLLAAQPRRNWQYS